jgi:hypothetical protein
MYFLCGTNWICKYYLEEIHASADRKSIGTCHSYVEEIWNKVDGGYPRLGPFASLLGATMCACLSAE